MALALVKLPKAWSSHDRVDQLTGPAYASLTRMLPRAVVETGVNFNINSAYRSKAEQIALFTANYRNRGARSKRAADDRMYAGTAWRWLGGVRVASPDLYGTGTGANHTRGIAIDIVPAAIQAWIQKNGGRFGWSWAEGRKNGEAWHFTYSAAGDQYRSEGTLDHAWVQRIVGASPVDGKIGTGTVAKIKAWQKAHGLEADGKVGPATKAAMAKGGGSGKSEAPADGAAPETTGESVSIAPLPTIETDLTSANVNRERFGEQVRHITIHWWGKPVGQTFESIRDYLVQDRGDSGTSAHYICKAGRVARIVPEEWTAWANGNRAANRQGISIECNPNDVLGTLPTLAALVKDIRSRYGDLPIYPHQHWTATECPGDYVSHLDQLDELARAGQAVVDAPATSTPSTPSTSGGGIPAGKDLLMALIAAPDFPLLRTDGHLCYYGPKTRPKESVSGHQANTLNPGDVGSSGSTGLKAWQKQMNKRGYSLTVDGKYGDACAKAAKNLQKLAGITQDGLVGPDCWYAAWLLPVK